MFELASEETHPNEMKVFSIWLKSYYALARREGFNEFPLMDCAQNSPITWTTLREMFMARMKPFDAVLYAICPF